MRLVFNNTNFLVVIGANPFDNIKAVASVVIDYIVHLDTSILIKELEANGAIVEISDNPDADKGEHDDDSFGNTFGVQKIFTIKTLGTGKLDTEDNDALHNEWLEAFDSVLRRSTVTHWKDRIGKDNDDG